MTRVNLIEIKGLSSLQVLFIVLWSQYTIVRWGCIILNQLPLLLYVTPYVFPTLLLCSIITAFPEIWNNIKIHDVFILIFGTMFWFISMYSHPLYVQYFHEYQNAYFTAFFYFYVGEFVFKEKIDGRFYNCLYFISVIGVFMAFSYFVLSMLRGKILESEYMDLAYKLLPSILFIFTGVFIKKNIRSLIFALISSLFLLLLGTRGPLVLLVLFIATILILSLDNVKKRLTTCVTAITILVLDETIGIFKNILLAIINIGHLLNINLRVLEAYLSNELLDSNGRDDIQRIIINKIEDNKWGYGVFSDRYYTEGLWGNKEGHYAHNILYELQIDFGILPGTLILVIVFCLIAKTLLGKDNSFIEKNIMLIIFLSGVLKLFFSGSWITETFFFLFIGSFIGMSINRKQDTIE